MFKKPENDSAVIRPEMQETTARSSPSEPRRDAAIIGPSITIKGDLTGEEDLEIQGKVEGKIDLKQNSITIGRSGRARAEVHGKLITVEGEVEGNLFGQDQIVIRNCGSVRGNLTAPRIAIEDGAKFKGSIDMESKPVDKPRPLPAPELKSVAMGASGAEHLSKGGITIRAESTNNRVS